MEEGKGNDLLPTTVTKEESLEDSVPGGKGKNIKVGMGLGCHHHV